MKHKFFLSTDLYGDEHPFPTSDFHRIVEFVRLYKPRRAHVVVNIDGIRHRNLHRQLLERYHNVVL